jgi:hypothetical protein
MSDEPTVQLMWWDGPWEADDPDANLKHDVALYTKLDPLTTLTTLSANTGIPVGALVRYVLARWASAGSEGLLTAGPTVVERMWDTVEGAEAVGTDDARLEAYNTLRQVLSWLRVPLDTEG